MPECPPWAPRHFARSCVRACARSPPRSTPYPRAGEMPGLDRRATPAFRPLVRSWPEPCGRRGGGRPPGGAGRPAGVAPGLQAVACSARGSRPGRAGETSVSVHGGAVAYRPLGWTRAGGAATRAAASASGRNTAVRPWGGRGISPARGEEAGSARKRGRQRPPGGAGRPVGVAPGLQAAACTACGSRSGRAGGTAGCVRRATTAFRPLAERAGTRGRAQRHVRDERRAGIGSGTWQPRMTASSGSTAR